MRYAPTREIYARPPRAVFQKQRCWKDHVSARRFCATFETDALPNMPEGSPSAPWRLGRLAG
eukprot:4454631-Pyramimonas_sp.AAC.1